MYISEDEPISVDINELNARTPDEINWSRGYQDENVLKIEFTLHNDIDQFEIHSSLQQLHSEIENKTEFTLTGVEYNISEHTGTFVFSMLGNIEPDKRVGELLSDSPSSIQVPKTVAMNNVVVCTGAFISFFDWGYSVDSISFVRNDGMYIKAIPDE